MVGSHSQPDWAGSGLEASPAFSPVVEKRDTASESSLKQAGAVEAASTSPPLPFVPFSVS